MLNTAWFCKSSERQASIRARNYSRHMSFDPRVAEVSTTRYGQIKFYTNSIFQTYLEHLDNLIKESLLPRQTPLTHIQNIEELFKNTNENFEKLMEKRSAFGSVGIPKDKKKRGRPKGSKGKKKAEEIPITQNVLPKAEKHIVEREPFETVKEFNNRKKEELLN